MAANRKNQPMKTKEMIKIVRKSMVYAAQLVLFAGLVTPAIAQ